ncbi:hypothetical protein PHYC_03963 [Phycisphaerales bacterium]|nr:hypothetical protein PHYC_03963 [Phycisphaerales bacterium]
MTTPTTPTTPATPINETKPVQSPLPVAATGVAPGMAAPANNQATIRGQQIPAGAAVGVAASATVVR